MRRIIWTLWGLYAVTLTAMIALVDLAWFEPLLDYRQTLVWMSDEAIQSRIGGLTSANRLMDAVAFARMHDLSLSLILIAILAGVTQALGAINPLPQRPRETHYVMGLLGAMTLLSPITTGWLATLSNGVSQPLYTATPAYWLATMILSALLIARYAAFGAHDLTLALRERLMPPQPGITAAE